MVVKPSSRRIVGLAAVSFGLLAGGCASTERKPAAVVQSERYEIDVEATGTPIDERLLGTNLPAWLGADRLTDPAFQQAALDSGVSVIRMPGGSWSNAYSWAACERDEEECVFADAAKPSDFARFLADTGLPGMWTVSINGTAEEAAAAVAFFNAEVGDRTRIGRDRNGVDWGTAGDWASLRSEAGLVDPVRIELWEVGNEVYGGKPSASGDCSEFGWEDVWSCDGTEYAVGTARNDGFLAFREAMLAVDPDIEVGAVGVAPTDAWSGFGDEVLRAVGDDLDFYIVHDYGFDRSPSPEGAVARPGEEWPALLDGLAAIEVPIAITEYNLVSFQDGDSRARMNQFVNAFYLTDTIGRLADGGVAIANQWNLMNGSPENGTDYGMLDAATGEANPSYVASLLWRRMLGDLVFVGGDGAGLRLFATRGDDGVVNVLALNTAPTQASVELAVRNGATQYSVVADEVVAPSLESDDATFNGISIEAGGFVEAPSTDRGTVADVAMQTFEPFSITRLQYTPA
jgi:hypothetical protein